MGMDSMEWGMDSILFQDGFHIFFTFFISPDLDPYGMSSFKINYYNILDKSTYINLFKYAREGEGEYGTE